MERPTGIIKQSPADFVVDEIPAYTPSGEGTHLYLHIRKTNRTTDDVVRELAQKLGVERRDIGVAGLKDKIAITTQWLSLPATAEPKVASLALEGVELLEHARHGNKLKTGHLHGNRFRIVVRGVAPAAMDEVRAALARIAIDGVPNAFGPQRFGRDGDTHERARAWLTGNGRAPNDPRRRRFEFSALQSSIFNAVLAARVEDGTWNVPITGDVLKKEETGGLFVCTDVQLDRERALRGEVCPTGPLPGDKMRQPEAKALELEQRISTPLLEGIDLHRARSLGEGTRRALRLRVSELSHGFCASSVDEPTTSEGSFSEGAIEVGFVLPKGAYATTVLEAAFSVMDPSFETKNEEE